MSRPATLTDWARKWGVTRAALDDLASVSVETGTGIATGAHESNVQARVRIEAAAHGLRLFRNNVGAGFMQDGAFIRWGLANDSTAMNAVVKSGDLIGFRPRVVTVGDVGKTVAQFVSRECKRANWTYRGSPEEQAQMKWAVMVNKFGGDARIVNGLGSFDELPSLSVLSTTQG